MVTKPSALIAARLLASRRTTMWTTSVLVQSLTRGSGHPLTATDAPNGCGQRLSRLTAAIVEYRSIAVDPTGIAALREAFIDTLTVKVRLSEARIVALSWRATYAGRLAIAKHVGSNAVRSDSY
jgi:hypothetical protein